MKHIFAVFKKEMKRFFTDKRMLISLFLPGILIFVLYTVMGKVMTNVEDSFIDKEYKYKIVLTDNYSSSPSHSILETTIKNTLVSLEYKDYAHGGKFDWQDIIASMIGAIIVLIIRLSLEYVIG